MNTNQILKSGFLDCLLTISLQTSGREKIDVQYEELEIESLIDK